MPVIGVPKTMDNDVPRTEYCIGFSTAITRAKDAITRQRTTLGSHERIGIFRIFGRDAGFTALYTAYVTSAPLRDSGSSVRSRSRLIELLVEDKRNNPSHYSLVVASEGATWTGRAVAEYGEADAFGHKKKVDIGQALGEEIKRRTGEETMISDLTYDLRGGEPDAIRPDGGHHLRQHRGGSDPRRGHTDSWSACKTAATPPRPCPHPQPARAEWTSRRSTTPSATAPTTQPNLARRCSSATTEIAQSREKPSSYTASREGRGFSPAVRPGKQGALAPEAALSDRSSRNADTDHEEVSEIQTPRVIPNKVPRFFFSRRCWARAGRREGSAFQRRPRIFPRPPHQRRDAAHSATRSLQWYAIRFRRVLFTV